MNNLISKLRAKKDSKKGFTLMEMLIVVAIIAILVAVSIPVFTSQLDNARKAADAANLRAAKAVVSAYALTEDEATAAADKLAVGMKYDIENGKFVPAATALEAYGKSNANKDKIIKIKTYSPSTGTIEVEWATAS